MLYIKNEVLLEFQFLRLLVIRTLDLTEDFEIPKRFELWVSTLNQLFEKNTVALQICC